MKKPTKRDRDAFERILGRLEALQHRLPEGFAASINSPKSELIRILRRMDEET